MVDGAALTLAGTGWEFRSASGPAEFPRTGWGHRGYEEAAVDEFVGQLNDEIAAANDQIDDLRLEVDRLHRYIRRQWAAVAAAESASAHAHGEQGESQRISTPAAQARAVLTQAQEIAERRLADAAARLAESQRVAQAQLEHADRRVAERIAKADELAARRLQDADAVAGERLDRVDALADELLGEARREAVRKRSRAQHDAQRLLTVARTRYEEIVIRAHQRAGQAAEVALHDFEDAAGRTTDAGRARAELEMKAAYLRTFAKVSRTALQAALDVTAREFDRLLGTSAPPAQAGPTPPALAGPTQAEPIQPAQAGPTPPALAGPTPPERIPALTAVASGAAFEARVVALPGSDGTIELSRISRSG